MLKINMVAATMLLDASSTYAAEGATPSQGDKPLSAIEHGLKTDAGSNQTVEQCWAKWLQDEDLKEGKNEKNGHLILVSQYKDAVVAPESSKWLNTRKSVFQAAEIRARAAMAETMSVLIRSDRALMASQMGGDNAPPGLQSASKALSLADKVNVLTDKALDNEIEKYDPKWKEDATPEQKKEAAVVALSHIQGHMAASSALFAAGAFTAVECEGPSKEADGKYAVLVGMIWSPKLEQVAEAIWNTSYKLPAEAPGGTIAEQFDSFASSNPDWMAYTMGVRVLTNEKGERVVIGFGVVPQTSMMSLDKRHAGLEALTAIQRFVGEKIASDRQGSESFESRELADGTIQAFDTGAFNEKITLASKELHLNGASEVLSWRGEHPWSKSKMQVVAFAWSPSWAADSVKTSEIMQGFERRMNGLGAVPSTNATQTKGHAYTQSGAAVPARSGAASSTRDF